MQQFLSAHLSLLEGHVNGAYSSPRVLSMALQFLTHAVDVKAAYALLADHMEPLLLRVAFPLMCFGDEDAALWREDPQEYVRKVWRASSSLGGGLERALWTIVCMHA